MPPTNSKRERLRTVRYGEYWASLEWEDTAPSYHPLPPVAHVSLSEGGPDIDKRIVAAVNSHAALVAALEIAVAEIERWQSVENGRTYNPDALDQMRAALKLAKGETK